MPLLANQPGVELRANLKSISHRCHLVEVAFVGELTKETIHLPLVCLQGGTVVKKISRAAGVKRTYRGTSPIRNCPPSRTAIRP